jgi:hypothetical protein
MKRRTRHFPGADDNSGQLMMRDVDADEAAAIEMIAVLRRSSGTSLEAIGFMLGTGANQISRYLNRSAGITLTNYLRIARCLGYRCKIVLERVEEGGELSLSDLNTVSHRVSSCKPPASAAD